MLFSNIEILQRKVSPKLENSGKDATPDEKERSEFGDRKGEEEANVAGGK